MFITGIVGRYLLVEGIDSSAYSNITMTLGHHKSSTSGSNELKIEVSSDGSNWTSLTYSRPTGSGTANWLLITPSGTIPSASNLRLRFTQTTTSTQFRIDDIKLSGTTSGANLPPVITNIIQTPSTDIINTTSVSVSADITNSDGTVTSAQLRRGTATGVYGNTLGMTASD